MQKKSALYMIVFLMAFAAQPARAEFAIAGDKQTCTLGIKGDICRHFFAKSNVVVTYTPDKTPRECPPVKAALVRVTANGEAVVEDAAVTQQTAKSCDRTTFTLQLPAADAETEFAVVLQQQAGMNEWKDTESVSLEAYPPTLLDGMRNWAASKGNALMLRDEDGRLGDFLDQNKMQYITEEVAPEKAHKVYLVVTPDDDSIEGDAIYFREQADILPVV